MDVAPALLEKVTRAFNVALAADRVIKALLGKLETKKAAYPDAEAYSARAGELLAAAVASEITGTVLPDGRMYYNIAEKVLGPSLKANHDNVTGYCKSIQERMNKEAGLTIKYIKPKFDEDRAKGIYIYASRHDDFDSIKDSLGAVITNFTQHSVDESIRVNAEFQARAGYKAKIIRTAEANCCEWCNDLEGEYEYPDGIPENVFARHDNCRCIVEYQIGDRAQDVWTKKWRENENAEKTEERKEFEKGVFNKRTEEKTEYAGAPKAWKKNLTAASEDAILSGTNPEYATSIGLTATLKDFDFAQNCTNAVVAYEMRCRGYDVTAQPLSVCRALMQKPFTAWEGGEENKLESDTIGEVLKYVESQREGARVQIAGSYKQSIWERKDGHTFIAEKHHENIVFKDPQSGAIIKSFKDASDFDHFEFLRIDNLEISSRGISACKGR